MTKKMTEAQIIRAAKKIANDAKKSQIIGGGFFYSPTDAIDNVLAITFSDLPNTLPLEAMHAIISPEYMAEQDEAYKVDKTLVSDYFEQLDWMLTEVNTNPGKMMSHDDMSYLCVLAGNIYWLTMRGFIKQSEYNGTQFQQIVTRK